jgi:hypothetical protein
MKPPIIQKQADRLKRQNEFGRETSNVNKHVVVTALIRAVIGAAIQASKP